jgi:integrase
MHSLRHFYASALLDAGESIKALAPYLGHADPGFHAACVHAPNAGQRRAHPKYDSCRFK